MPAAPKKTLRRKPIKKVAKKTPGQKRREAVKPLAKKAAAKRSPAMKVPAPARPNPEPELEALTAPLAQISTSKLNPRKDLGDIEGLAASIAEVGLLQPLVVQRVSAGKFELIAGERRYTALKRLKRKTADVVVKPPFADVDVLIAATVENVQRENLNAIEEASGYQQLIDTFGLSRADVARRVNVSPAHVTKRLALLDLPGAVQKEVAARTLGATDAYELSRLAAFPKAADLIREIREDADSNHVADLVTRELENREREQARETLIAEFNAKGVTVLERGHTAKCPRVVRPGAGYGSDLEVDVAKHRKEPCRAVVIELRWGSTKPEVIEYCTDPSRHSAKGASDLKAPKKAGNTKSAQEQQRNRATREANERRRGFMHDLLHGASSVPGRTQPLVPAPVITMLALRRFATKGWAAEAKAACELLDLEPIAVSWNPKQKDWPGTLSTYLADADEPTVLRVVLARLLAEGETHGQLRADHYRFLLDVGYEPTDFERKDIVDAIEDASLVAAHEAAHDLSDQVHNQFGELGQEPDEHYLELSDELSEGTTLDRALQIREELEAMLLTLAGGSDGDVEVERGPACRVCGCTEEEACEGGCGWVDDPEQLGALCSQCANALDDNREEEVEPQRAAAQPLALDDMAPLETIADIATLDAASLDAAVLAEPEPDEPQHLTPGLTDYAHPPINRFEEFLRADIAKLEPTVPAVIALQQELYAGVNMQRIAPMMKEVKALSETYARAF